MRGGERGEREGDSARSGWPGVGILQLVKTVGLICNV